MATLSIQWPAVKEPVAAVNPGRSDAEGTAVWGIA